VLIGAVGKRLVQDKRSLIGLTRHDLHGCGSGAGGNHGVKVRVALVFRSIGVVDASLNWPLDGGKVTSFVMPAAAMRPDFCRSDAWYQREFWPL
jgi:hypothetical protein